MTDTQILIANYQSIIRVLASQVRTLELQINKDAAGCVLLPEDCNALHNFIRDELDCSKIYEEYGTEFLYTLLSAWEKIRKVREQNV